MSSPPEDSEKGATSDDQSGLSYGPVLVLLSAAVVVGSGLLVYRMEQASLPLVADFVWVGGYGIAVGIIWMVWLRPVDFVGPMGRETVDNSGSGETILDSSESDDPGMDDIRMD